MGDLIQFASISKKQGSSPRDGYLLVAEQHKNVPFDIKRVYCVFCSDAGVVRGRHAHKKLKQVVMCLRGHCRIILDDGHRREATLLSDGSQALLINQMIWREITGFSSDCILLVLASELYDEKDYIHDYDTFLACTKKAV